MDISKIVTLLDVRVEEAIKNEVEPQVEEPAKEEVQEPEQETPPLEPKKDFVPVKKSTRRRWTDESKLEFLEYYDAHGAKKTAEEYGIQIGSVHTTRFKFYKELRANGKLKARLDDHQE